MIHILFILLLAYMVDTEDTICYCRAYTKSIDDNLTFYQTINTCIFVTYRILNDIMSIVHTYKVSYIANCSFN